MATTRGDLFRQVREKLGNDETAALLEFVVRALADSVSEKTVRGLYVFGQTADNEGEVLDLAARWLRQGRTDAIIVPDQHGNGHPPHAKRWVEALIKRGLKEANIMLISAQGDSGKPNTQTECVPLLRECESRNWGTLAITAAAFHLPRAFLTILSEVVRGNHSFKVYAVAPYPGDWTKTVAHSQGQVFGTRADTIMHEMLRMASYANLIRPSAALAYLDRR